jgi:hypothetical protein
VPYAKATAAGKTLYLHRVQAEAALGHPLPPKAVVHHADGTLVICQDQSYHMLLHQRMRVLARGGDQNTQRICSACQHLTSDATFRKSMCPSCQRVTSDAAKGRLHARRRAAGECIACGKPASGFVRCTPCRAANLESQRRWKVA